MYAHHALILDNGHTHCTASGNVMCFAAVDNVCFLGRGSPGLLKYHFFQKFIWAKPKIASEVITSFPAILVDHHNNITFEKERSLLSKLSAKTVSFSYFWFCSNELLKEMYVFLVFPSGFKKWMSSIVSVQNSALNWGKSKMLLTVTVRY